MIRIFLIIFFSVIICATLDINTSTPPAVFWLIGYCTGMFNGIIAAIDQ